MPEFVNASAGTTLVAGQKWRLTHAFRSSGLIPGELLDAPNYAIMVREAYPSAGCYAVSLPEATRGDKVIVFDVRLSAQGAAQYGNAGTWATALNGADGLALTVERMERLTAGAEPGAVPSSEDVEARDAARDTGNAANPVGGFITTGLRDVLGGIGKIGPWLLLIGGAVALLAVTRGGGVKVWE